MFTPISPQKLNDGLELFFNYLDNSDAQLLIKTAIAHVEFEALHPFKDGNGRIGRMLIPLYLWQQGAIFAPHFYISAYFEEHKEVYIEHMRNVSRQGDWTSWVVFFLEAVSVQAKRNLEMAENINNLYEEIKPIFKEILSPRWYIEALDYIFANPIYLNRKFIENSNIPPQVATRTTRKLLEAGWLMTVSEPAGRRSGIYAFEPLLKLVRV